MTHYYPAALWAAIHMGSEQVAVEHLCVFFVHMPCACVFALCDPECPIGRRSMTQADGCQCSTSLFNITRHHTVPYYVLHAVKSTIHIVACS